MCTWVKETVHWCLPPRLGKEHDKHPDPRLFNGLMTLRQLMVHRADSEGGGWSLQKVEIEERDLSEQCHSSIFRCLC